MKGSYQGPCRFVFKGDTDACSKLTRKARMLLGSWDEYLNTGNGSMSGFNRIKTLPDGSMIQGIRVNGMYMSIIYAGGPPPCNFDLFGIYIYTRHYVPVDMGEDPCRWSVYRWNRDENKFELYPSYVQIDPSKREIEDPCPEMTWRNWHKLAQYQYSGTGYQYEFDRRIEPERSSTSWTSLAVKHILDNTDDDELTLEKMEKWRDTDKRYLVCPLAARTRNYHYGESEKTTFQESQLFASDNYSYFMYEGRNETYRNLNHYNIGSRLLRGNEPDTLNEDHKWDSPKRLLSSSGSTFFTYNLVFNKLFDKDVSCVTSHPSAPYLNVVAYNVDLVKEPLSFGPPCNTPYSETVLDTVNVDVQGYETFVTPITGSVCTPIGNYYYYSLKNAYFVVEWDEYYDPQDTSTPIKGNLIIRQNMGFETTKNESEPFGSGGGVDQEGNVCSTITDGSWLQLATVIRMYEITIDRINNTLSIDHIETTDTLHAADYTPVFNKWRDSGGYKYVNAQNYVSVLHDIAPVTRHVTLGDYDAESVVQKPVDKEFILRAGYHKGTLNVVRAHVTSIGVANYVGYEYETYRINPGVNDDIGSYAIIRDGYEIRLRVFDSFQVLFDEVITRQCGGLKVEEYGVFISTELHSVNADGGTISTSPVYNNIDFKLIDPANRRYIFEKLHVEGTISGVNKTIATGSMRLSSHHYFEGVDTWNKTMLSNSFSEDTNSSPLSTVFVPYFETGSGTWATGNSGLTTNNHFGAWRSANASDSFMGENALCGVLMQAMVLGTPEYVKDWEEGFGKTSFILHKRLTAISGAAGTVVIGGYNPNTYWRNLPDQFPETNFSSDLDLVTRLLRQPSGKFWYYPGGVEGEMEDILDYLTTFIHSRGYTSYGDNFLVYSERMNAGTRSYKLVINEIEYPLDTLADLTALGVVNAEGQPLVLAGDDHSEEDVFDDIRKNLIYSL